MAHVARHYIPAGGLVYDFGASTGNVGRALADTLRDRGARLVPVEVSAAMCALYDAPGRENLVCGDATELELEPFDLAVCCLALMFMPKSRRGDFVARLRARVRPGGAIIVLDKCEAASGYAATVLWRLTLAGKVAAQVPAGEIVAKELSLGGVQRPIAPAELGPALEWFRFGEFAGWLIEA